MSVVTDKLSDVLTLIPHFDLLRSTCENFDVYIVGGALRDALLGRPISDLDLISPVDPTPQAKAFARKIKGHWFWLDEDRRQSRVVIDTDNTSLFYDFALFRADDLEKDLLDRDFTINALAISLAGDLSIHSLVDPCNGLEDLRQSRLRMVSQISFSSDPLRVLKGVRHATALTMQIDIETLEAMTNYSFILSQVAPERIRKEVWRILEDSQVARGLQLLSSSGAGLVLFGDAYPESIPGMLGTLRHYQDIRRQLVDKNNVVSEWLSVVLEQGLRCDTLLLMVFMLGNVSSGLPVALAEEWCLSKRTASNISALTLLDDQVVNQLAAVAYNERAYAWWANSCNVEPRLLLLAVAIIGSKETGDVPDLIHSWIPLVNTLENTQPADLVDGHWLRRTLSIKDGPEMSKAMEMVRNAEMSGEVSSSDDAKEFLAGYYQNKH
jgi:poly(A) polymerase